MLAEISDWIKDKTNLPNDPKKFLENWISRIAEDHNNENFNDFIGVMDHFVEM